MKQIDRLTYRMRIVLIDAGKSIPFLLCGIVAVSYIENIYSLMLDKIVLCGNYYILDKPISWFLGNLFEYNFQFVVLLAILSIAIRTCIFNKLAIAYLALQLFEKSYFQSHEWANYSLYYLVSAVNVVVCLFFVVKGTQQLIRH